MPMTGRLPPSILALVDETVSLIVPMTEGLTRAVSLRHRCFDRWVPKLTMSAFAFERHHSQVVEPCVAPGHETALNEPPREVQNAAMHRRNRARARQWSAKERKPRCRSVAWTGAA